MRIHVWGTDYRRDKEELRQKLYIAPEHRAEKLKEIVALGFSDLVYLATCNRVEFYTSAPTSFSDLRNLWIKLFAYFGLPEDCVYQGYALEGKSALRHLARVSTSLESLVIGENQILSQLKDAVTFSLENKIPVESGLLRCFQWAFETSKRVRTETEIGKRLVSVASLGIEKLRREESEFPVKNAVVVGRGSMSRSVLSYLLKEKSHSQITWVNRDVEKLREHPESERVNLVTLDEFCHTPISFSHLFTATASENPIFDAPFLGKLSPEKKVIFDFAEPADVDSEACSHLPSIRLVRMSDLKEEAKENKDFRRDEAARAEKIIELAMQEYFLEQKEAPVLKEFIGVEDQFRSEVKEWLSEWQTQFPVEWHSTLNKLAEHLLKKNLHLSREQLKSALRKVAREGTQQMTHA